jgi:glycosyltransferase involved in cell wall biosynthesis
VTHAASDDLARRALACGGRDVRLAPVGAPAVATTGRDPGLGSPLVLAVGRLHPQKGYDVLIDALPVIGDAVVAVAGDGPLRDELTARAPQVRWLGRRDDVGDLYAAADVVVLPSVWEARSLTAQEALRAGRPLVATDVGGIAGLVGDGAVLVPPGDPQALGTAVRRLLDAPAEAEALAARGLEVAAGWPDESDTVAQVAALYAELLG